MIRLPDSAHPARLFRALRVSVRFKAWAGNLHEWAGNLYRRAAGRAATHEWIRHTARILARLSVQLNAGTGAAVALTFIASLVAWLAFDRVGDAQVQVNETSLPQLAGSFAVAQRGSALAVAATRLTGADTLQELSVIEGSIQTDRQAFEIELSALTGHSGERFDRVRFQGGALLTNIDAIETSARERFTLDERAADLRTQLAGLESEFAGPAGAAGADLGNNGALAVQLLINALNVSDAATLQTVRQRFDNVVATVRINAPAVARLRDLGFASQGVFELRTRQLALDERQRELLIENRNFAAGLLAEIEGLVDGAQEGAAIAAGASQNAIGTGRVLLVAINGIAIVTAALIAWLLVGRLLLSRLQALSDRMRAMAEGDLEAEVDIGGRDEVAEMAAALEVFRRHALEVQRLNLVEKLAAELRGKNEQLETALEDLRRAQNQIVAREKLAGLGELTAGVAHEIRNPLNFVFNFSEASGELLEELSEELETENNAFSDAQKRLLQGICLELDDCLKRIRSHGGRAARILSDMLKMGSSTGERQPTEINGLLREQVRIALETIQAADAGSPLDIAQDLDPDAGQVEIVPRDMGRVFHNLLLNAWHATDERRRSEDPPDAAYEPAIIVSTRRLVDCLQVRVRDNGTGIPDEVVNNIFNPFFTTKPTDQGTGLGLSLCADILRGHGGEIRVKTEWGSHTEMIVELPVSNVPSES